MVFIRIVKNGGSQGVQAFVMTALVIVHIGRFCTEKPMPYFQPFAQNPPLGFGNFGGGIPTRGGALLQIMAFQKVQLD
jgi:hypothetical protein